MGKPVFSLSHSFARGCSIDLKVNLIDEITRISVVKCQHSPDFVYCFAYRDAVQTSNNVTRVNSHINKR